MASFLSRLMSMFGGASAKASRKEAEPREYEGFRIFATPIREGAQFRLAGRIEKDFGEETRVRTFIRADIFTSEADAIEFTFRKAEQIISQSRGALFADGAASGNI